MSDKEISIEYSLNTPVYANSNILNKKLFEMIKNNNMNGGGGNMYGGLYSSNCIGILIGLILIIIGFIFLLLKNDLVETEAKIITKSCVNNGINGINRDCKLNITYIVDTTQYSKIITIPESNVLNESTLKIYYSHSEPNSIQLHNINYSSIGIGLLVVGSIILIFSVSDEDRIKSSSSSTSATKLNVYPNSSNVGGLNVVYS